MAQVSFYLELVFPENHFEIFILDDSRIFFWNGIIVMGLLFEVNSLCEDLLYQKILSICLAATPKIFTTVITQVLAQSFSFNQMHTF